MINFNENKESFEIFQRTINLFDKLVENSLQDNVIDRKVSNSRFRRFTKYVKETRTIFLSKLKL